MEIFLILVNIAVTAYVAIKLRKHAKECDGSAPLTPVAQVGGDAGGGPPTGDD